MKILYNKSLAFVALTLLFSGACKKEDPVIPNEEEIITTLIYTLTPDSGGVPVELTFRDLDGDGGNAPIITDGYLNANKNYSGTLMLLNEIETPAGDISKEIKDEDQSHQFFFAVAGGLELDISYDDQDSEGNPVGLTTHVTTGNVSQGQLTIVLRHKPDKSATGVAEGNITNAGGETDIEVSFGVYIQ